MTLPVIEGPLCPACHCQDSAVIRRDRYREAFRELRCCRFCGRQWWTSSKARPDPDADTDGTGPAGERPVIYHVVICPACGSKRTRVTSTRRPIRHHKCQACSHTFKSMEKSG